MAKKVQISVVIPAYNESKRIKRTLLQIEQYLSKHKAKYEIIVIDDGSTDDTVKVVKSLKIKNLKILINRKNMGKGGSVRKGMLNSRGEYVLFSDADLSTPIEELDKLLRHIKKYDIVIGSRALSGSNIKQHQPALREIIGKTFNFLVRFFTGLKIKDTQCGFKLFKGEATKEIFQKQKTRGFSFDVEVLYLAKRMRYSIKEVPITWINSPQSKVSAVKDSIKMLLDIIRIRFFFVYKI